MADSSVYVLSEDLHLLLDRWSMARFDKVFSLPYDEIRAKLTQILTFNNHKVVRVSADQMHEGMAALLEHEQRPVISVDPVYWPTDRMLQITRCVHYETLENIDGFYARFGFPDPVDQVSDLVSTLHKHFNGLSAEVVLVDDVVFSGKVVVAVIQRLAEEGIRVVRVVCGIAVVEPTQSDPFAMCQKLGAVLHAAFTFGAEGTPKAVDEVCERDFFVFCPMSGRSLYSEESNQGYPYIEPFGLAHSWASFGEFSPAISQKLIQLNIDILELIEQQLGREILFADLDRLPVRLLHPEVKSDSVRLHLLAHLL